LISARSIKHNQTPRGVALLALRDRAIILLGSFAASQVLDRGWGKPMQQVEHSGEIGHTISARLDAALRRLAGARKK
jgi:hypothetical protein